MLIYLIMAGKVHASGGWGKYVREFANYLADHGNVAKILSRMGEVLTVRGGRMKTGFPDLPRPRQRTGSSFLVMARHLPNPLTVLLGLMKLLRDFKLHKNDQKIIHIHDISSSLLIAFLARKILKSSFLVQIHGFPLKEQSINLGRSSSPKANLIWFLTRIWHSLAVNLIKASSVLVLVNNDEVKSYYEFLGIHPGKLKVLSSAIDLQECEKSLISRISARQRLGISKNEFVVGYVGGLREEKNLSVLIEATSDFIKDAPEAKIRLVIIGDGPMRPSLEKIVKEYNIDRRVLFVGYIPEAHRFLNAIDVFVLPSLSEGSPFSLIEAMGSGKAIVASNIPAIQEIVEDGKEGILVDPHESEQFKKAMLELYKDTALRRELGEKAKSKAKLYDINAVFPKMLQIYDDLKKAP